MNNNVGANQLLWTYLLSILVITIIGRALSYLWRMYGQPRWPAYLNKFLPIVLAAIAMLVWIPPKPAWLFITGLGIGAVWSSVSRLLASKVAWWEQHSEPGLSRLAFVLALVVTVVLVLALFWWTPVASVREFTLLLLIISVGVPLASLSVSCPDSAIVVNPVGIWLVTYVICSLPFIVLLWPISEFPSQVWSGLLSGLALGGIGAGIAPLAISRHRNNESPRTYRE